jgi:multidrug efflux system outer membrane protein
MQLMIAGRTLTTYAESVRMFELQFRYGQVSQMTLEQARTQYETAAGMIPQIESQIAQTENALSILLGRNPGPIQRSRSLFELTIPAVPAGLPSDVLTNRPDIRQSEQNLIAANAQIGAARALYFPTISLTGNLGASSAELSDLFKGSSRVWNFAGSVTGPIFTAGSISGQVQQAEAGRKAALITYESTIQNAFADVENALVAREKQAEQLHAQERLVRASKEYARLAQLQYEGGYSPYLTVLSAQQQLFPAEINHAQYLASAFISYVNLYKAMGGGWVTASEKMTTYSRTDGSR